MAEPYSFQDELARQRAEIERDQERAKGQAGYRRFQDFQLGKAVGDALSAKITAGTPSAAEAAQNLRRAARDQGDTLSGQVAAGELAETARAYEAEAERQRPQQEADAALMVLRQRIAREQAEWQGATDRDHYERHRER